MKKVVLVACGIVLLALAASAQAPGASQWTGTQLRDLEKALAQKMNASKSASEVLADPGTHLVQLSYREASGEAEVHERVTDVFLIQSGKATLVTGGKVVGGKTTAPGEIRGASITGGQSKPLGPGDVVNIPAGTPHQVLMEGAKPFAYLVVKVRIPAGGAPNQAARD